MENDYYLIQGKPWGSKIHIILPSQLNEQNETIDEQYLSQPQNHTGWCITEVENGIVKKPKEYINRSYRENTLYELKNNMCVDCLKIAQNATRRPKFLDYIVDN